MRSVREYNIDVRSKSDAQIAEAVIKAQLSFKPQRRFIPHGYKFNYPLPTSSAMSRLK